MRYRTFAAAIAAIGVVASVPAATPAHGDGGKKIGVVLTPTNIVSEVVGAPICDAASQCVTFVKVTVDETGDAVGTVVQGIVLATNSSSRSPYSASGAFAGTVEQCGSGGFLFAGGGVVDPVTGVGPLEFSVVPGSGGADLEGITGQFQPQADGSLLGWVRCRAQN
jgi:hypothetical protein